jgi:hypothetical protein
MARRRIRHFGGRALAFIPGDPPENYPPLWCRADAERGGFWITLNRLSEIAKEAKRKALEEKRAKRAATQTRFGKGSGKAGGGRGAAHKIHHWRSVNKNLTAKGCPICHHSQLWKLWLLSGYGQRKHYWDAWPAETMTRREIMKLCLAGTITRERKKWLLSQKGVFRFCELRDQLVKSRPSELEELQKEQKYADRVFDAYMRVHRDEHKPDDDYNIWIIFGVPYDPQRDYLPYRPKDQQVAPTDPIAIPTASHIPDETDLSDGAIIQTGPEPDQKALSTHQKQFSSNFHNQESHGDA